MYLFGLGFNFDISEDAANTCKHINHACPIKGGEDITLVFKEVIEGILASAKVDLELSVKDDKGKNLFCARFDAKVFTSRRPHQNELVYMRN